MSADTSESNAFDQIDAAIAGLSDDVNRLAEGHRRLESHHEQLHGDHGRLRHDIDLAHKQAVESRAWAERSVGGLAESLERLRAQLDEVGNRLRTVEDQASVIAHWRRETERYLDDFLPQVADRLKKTELGVGTLTEDRQRRSSRYSALIQVVVGITVAALAVTAIILYIAR